MLAFVRVQTVLSVVKSKFFVGIVVVLSLQICFQVFNALDRADDRYYQVRATTTVPSPMDASPILVAAIPDAEEDREFAPPYSPPIVVRQGSVALVRPRSVSFRTEPKTQPLFETIRITYRTRPAVPMTATPKASKAITTVARAERPDVARAERPEEKKHSVLARAVVPLVKKPYEFFKLVGSKLW